MCSSAKSNLNFTVQVTISIKKNNNNTQHNSCNLSTNFDPNNEMESEYRYYFMTDFGSIISTKFLF